MNYYINPTALSGVFTVPSAVADNYLKLSKSEHIKVLLYVLRNISSDPEDNVIAEECGISEYDVKEALLYWADAGILLPKNAPIIVEKKTKSVVKRNEKPSRQDIAKRSMTDPKIQYLVGEAQKRFARNLKDNETRTLVWLYDDGGLDISVILLVVQYALQKGKGTIGFIEKVCLDLIEKGIDNITDADTELHKKDLGEKCWQIVTDVFGIKKRNPSDKELNDVKKWIEDWQLSKETLKMAYDECVNQKSEFSFRYVAKIIENWHNNGMKPTKKKTVKEKEDFVTYDIDLFEKMINAKD